MWSLGLIYTTPLCPGAFYVNMAQARVIRRRDPQWRRCLPKIQLQGIVVIQDEVLNAICDRGWMTLNFWSSCFCLLNARIIGISVLLEAEVLYERFPSETEHTHLFPSKGNLPQNKVTTALCWIVLHQLDTS